MFKFKLISILAGKGCMYLKLNFEMLFKTSGAKEILQDTTKIEPSHKKNVQVGKDQENAQSEKDSHSKNRGGKNYIKIRYLYHENIS